MNIFKVLFFAAAAIFIFNRCSTDVDIYSDYKDITIVYGLLDKSEDTVWLKVTKAFLGEGNALHFAKNPDSSNYANKLDVTLSGIKNGSEVQKLVFDTITIHNKQAGDSVFYYPNQLMYYAVAPSGLNADAMYHLLIKKGNEDIEASTSVVNDFAITYPIYKITFKYDKEIQWNSAKNGKRYEVSLTFHYKELLPNTTDTLDKSISWSLGVKKSAGTEGDEPMGAPYSGEQFYSLLENSLEPVLNVKRWAGNVDVKIACGSDDFNTYYEVNNTGGGSLQEVPAFTNIEGKNSIGLLAARHNVVKISKLSSDSELKLVNEYKELGFILNR